MAVENEIQEKPNSRQRLTDRYRNSRPDLNWDGEGADNDIDALAADELDAYDKDKAARQEFDGKMNKMFNDNPGVADLFVKLSEGKGVLGQLFDLLGDDIVELSQTEEGRAIIKARAEAKEAEIKKNEADKATFLKNMETSGRNLIAVADKYGLTDEQAEQIGKRADEIIAELKDGIYSTDLLEGIYKSGNYDKAVADARAEGHRDGKNETIRRELRQSKSPTGLPATAGSQDMVAQESAPTKKKPRSIAALGGIPVSKK